MKKKLWVLWFVFFGSIQFAYGQNVLVQKSEGMTFQVEKIADDLDIPWGMAFLNQTELIFTELPGTINVLNIVSLKITTLANIKDVHYSGQGGLMDVAVLPDYKTGAWIYFTYAKKQKNQGVTTLARAKKSGNNLKSWEDLLVTKSATNTNRHFGSRIAFDEKGHLFFTVGERGHRPNGQNLSTHAGSILRVNLDGSVPKGNPFVNTANALPEIWSYGHRNPQGISFDFSTGKLWAIEHGPRGGDEINLIQAKKNYGWPIVSYGKEYWGPVQVGEGTEKEGMEQPVKIYVPSIAPGSLIYYTGKAFPNWQGNLLAGALKLTHLNRIVLDQAGKVIKEERLLKNLGERIRSLVQSPEGWIYLSTDSGKILRIKPLKRQT